MKLFRLQSLPFEGRIIAAAALVCIPVVYLCMSTITRLHATHLHDIQEQQLILLASPLKLMFEPSTRPTEEHILSTLKNVAQTNALITTIQWQTQNGAKYTIQSQDEPQRYPGWFDVIADIPSIAMTIPLEQDKLTLHSPPTPLLNIAWRFFQTILALSSVGIVVFLSGLYAFLVKLYHPIRQAANALDNHIQRAVPWTIAAEGAHDWARIVRAITQLVNQTSTLRQEHIISLKETHDTSILLHTLLETVPIPIYFKEINGSEEIRNRALTTFFGLKNPTQPLPLDSAAAERDQDTDRKICASPKSMTYEITYQMQNGDKKAIRILKSPVLAEDGEIRGIIAIMEDISVQRDMETELRNADYEIANLRASHRAKNAFVANISHEMRTPLTAIIGFSETLLDHDQTMADRIDGIKTIIRAGKHLHQIINEILDLAKIESGKLDLEYSDVQLFGLMDEIAALAKIQARNNGASFNIKYQFPLPTTIHCDPVRTKQILYNLIGNAIKFSRGGDIELTVGFAREKNLLAFAVKDNGIGIAPDRLSRLFAPFAQAEISTTRNYGGTGLGLYLSRSLAQSMGGDIAVTSELGKGSCFTARIQVGSMQENSLTYEPITSLPEAEGHHQPDMILGSVLIVDDQPDNRRLVEIYLRKLGVQCQLAENGEQALAILEKTPFDLVLMDINMPIMDGVTAIRLLREKGYTGTVFAFTADIARENINSCIESGFNDIIPKPIDRQSLITKVSAHLTPASEIPLQISPLPSTLPLNDPSNLELIRFFIDVLPVRLKELRNAYSLGNWNEIQEKATLLQEIGSGYGYPKVTETAAKLKFCAAKSDKAETKLMLDRLNYLADCIAMGAQQASTSPQGQVNIKGKSAGSM